MVQLEIEQKELEERLQKYKRLMKEKELEYQKLGTEKRNALHGVENLDIEDEEDKEERSEEERSEAEWPEEEWPGEEWPGEHHGVEVEADENTC